LSQYKRVYERILFIESKWTIAHLFKCD
jgi:hypothetical protein